VGERIPEAPRARGECSLDTVFERVRVLWREILEENHILVNVEPQVIHAWRDERGGLHATLWLPTTPPSWATIDFDPETCEAVAADIEVARQVVAVEAQVRGEQG
jgi:hypothetical protein